MQATIRLAGGNRLIQVEGESQKDLFEQMAMAHEVFGESTCGLCGSTNIRPVVRIAQKFKFYEYACQEPGCWAKLTFGQSQEGDGLFPKRKLLDNGKPDPDGEFGPHKGWTKYRGDNQEEPAHPRYRSDEPPARVPSHSQHSGLPPEDPFQTLKNALYDLGVPKGESQFAGQVLRFVSKGDEGGPITLADCNVSPATCKTALALLEVANVRHGNNLLKEVQKWIAGGMK